MNILVCFKFRVDQWQKLIVPADKKQLKLSSLCALHSRGALQVKIINSPRQALSLPALHMDR